MDSASVLMAAQQLLELSASRNSTRADMVAGSEELVKPDQPANPPLLNGFVKPIPHPLKAKGTHVVGVGLMNGSDRDLDEMGGVALTNGSGVALHGAGDEEDMAVGEDGEEEDRASHLTLSSHSPTASPPPLEDSKGEINGRLTLEDSKEGDKDPPTLKIKDATPTCKEGVDAIPMELEWNGMFCVGV